MPQVLVNIGGRSYRLACNPGEEEHLATLAKFVDGKIAEMHGAFRDIGDQRIVVMAALAIADELFDAKKKVETAKADSDGALARQKADSDEALARHSESRAALEARAARLEAAVLETTSRIEALTESLTASAIGEVSD
jgi:cell division protein ZapA